MLDSITKIITGLQELNGDIENIKNELYATKTDLYLKEQKDKKFREELVDLLNRYEN